MRLVLSSQRATLYQGDASTIRSVIAPESVDAVVTDPPAGIGFMGKEWDGDKGGREHWIAWLAHTIGPAFEALKPGGHALVWALPRTSHWTATALELAGFEIRDVVMHLFGTGFPKSLDVSKAIDERLGAERELLGYNGHERPNRVGTSSPAFGTATIGGQITAPATPAAAQWSGWGTALKPAAEHWILARKPLSGSVAANVLDWGTGGLNVDACRIGMSEEDRERARVPNPELRVEGAITWSGTGRSGDRFEPAAAGRWPANVTLDEEAAAMLDEQSGLSRSPAPAERSESRERYLSAENHAGGFAMTGGAGGYADRGGASRFFYIAKGSRSEKDAGLEHLPERSGNDITGRADGSAGSTNPRAGTTLHQRRNVHPTVKSIALMRWLARLITPPGGLVLDVFTGSGTTGVAALAEGFRFVGIERDTEYAEIARARLERVLDRTEIEPPEERAPVEIPRGLQLRLI